MEVSHVIAGVVVVVFIGHMLRPMNTGEYDRPRIGELIQQASMIASDIRKWDFGLTHNNIKIIGCVLFDLRANPLKYHYKSKS